MELYYLVIFSVEFNSPITLADDAAWIKFNEANSAYYKVNYPDETWIKFGEMLGADTDVSSPYIKSKSHVTVQKVNMQDYCERKLIQQAGEQRKALLSPSIYL